MNDAWQPVGTCGACWHPVAEHARSGCHHEGCSCALTGLAGWKR